MEPSSKLWRELATFTGMASIWCLSGWWQITGKFIWETINKVTIKRMRGYAREFRHAYIYIFLSMYISIHITYEYYMCMYNSRQLFQLVQTYGGRNVFFSGNTILWMEHLFVTKRVISSWYLANIFTDN